jgi:hypothetical protein
MYKMMGVILAVSVGFLVACSGSGGILEGDTCGGSTDQCHNNLTCQPIQGRTGDFCCPTPPQSSTQTNCHAM